jgi:hypothetical protein
MDTIKIEIKSEDEKKWIFSVRVEDMDYEVDVRREDCRRLTSGKIEPKELVEKSFEFLLAREPKESILKQFNLMEIARYFPEYESEISK